MSVLGVFPRRHIKDEAWDHTLESTWCNPDLVFMVQSGTEGIQREISVLDMDLECFGEDGCMVQGGGDEHWADEMVDDCFVGKTVKSKKYFQSNNL